jgi:carbon storage regulator
MLVLSRQRDETIMIGDDIEITVVDIRGDKVRLGINAPTRIAVHRKEVYEAIRKENEQAAIAASSGLPGVRPQTDNGQPIRPGPQRSRPSATSRLTAGNAPLDDSGGRNAEPIPITRTSAPPGVGSLKPPAAAKRG